jgi:hypothetical protein
MYASIRVENPGCVMKVKSGVSPLEVPNGAVRRVEAASPSGAIECHERKSIPAGTRKTANYACIG